MKCPKCNEELKEGSIICPNCGNTIQKQIDKDKDKEKSCNGLILGCSAIISALIILCIKSELSPKKFFITYFIIFVFVYLFIGLIYIIFFKNKKRVNKK